jgi:hypothetical protein
VFHFIGSIAWLAIAGTASILGYWQARRFTQNKLRYVDAVHQASIPVLVGAAAVLVATPVALFLPAVTMTTAFLFGGGVAMGVAAGARDIRRRIGAG